jgi:hypothetical protein
MPLFRARAARGSIARAFAIGAPKVGSPLSLIVLRSNVRGSVAIFPASLGAARWQAHRLIDGRHLFDHF